MTVTTTANSISYAGNGVTTAFAFPYIFFAPDNLVVTLFDVAANAYINPPPVLNGIATYDYTVTGVVTHGEYASGGTVTFNAAPLTGYTVSLVRVVPAIQTVTLIDNTKFPADTINTEFDYLTVLAQQSNAAPAPAPAPSPPVASPIVEVVAGIGLSGGGTSGIVTVNLEPNAPGVVPIGGIVDFAGSVAPANWLLCQGQSLATAGTYGVLFTAIGYAFGGSGANFNLPDCRGRVTAMLGGPAILSTVANTMGAVGGVDKHPLVLAELASHNHAVGDHSHNGLGGFNFLMANAGTAFGTPGAATAAMGFTGQTGGMAAGVNTGTTGTGTAHQNTQPTIILNKIIRFA